MMVVDSCKVKNGKLLLLLYSIKTRLECSAISVAAVSATTPPPSHRATSDQRRRRRRWLMILYWQRANRGSRRKGTRKQVVLATRSGGGAVSITYIVVPPVPLQLLVYTLFHPPARRWNWRSETSGGAER